MSTESDLLWSLFNDSTKPELPFFAPLPQVDAPPPESFDNEFSELEFDGPVQLPIQLEDTFTNLRGSTPVFTSPSAFTHSTESGYDLAASEYSYVGYPASNYSMPLDMAFHNVRVSSEYGGVDTMHDSIYSSAFHSSFGPLPPSPSPSPPVRVAKALSDYGPSKPRQPHFGISPDNLSLPRPHPTSAVPTVLSVQAPDTQTNTGPNRAHQCPNCNRGKNISYFLKESSTHSPPQPLHVHSTSRLTWIHTTLREQSHSYVPTVAASALSAASTTSNVIGPLFIETKHHRRQCTRIRPEFQNLRLALPRALELGARNVVRVMLGVRGVATAMMSNKN